MRVGSSGAEQISGAGGAEAIGDAGNATAQETAGLGQAATQEPTVRTRAMSLDMQSLGLASQLDALLAQSGGADGASAVDATDAVGCPPQLADFAGIYEAEPGASSRFLKVEVQDGELSYTFADSREAFDDQDVWKSGGSFQDIGEPEENEHFNDHDFFLRPDGTETARTSRTTLKDGVLRFQSVVEKERGLNRDEKMISDCSMTLKGNTLTFDQSRTGYRKGLFGVGGYKLDPDALNTLPSKPVQFRKVGG